MKSFLRYLRLIYAGQWPREVDERGGGAAWLWQDAKSNIFVPPNSTAAHLSRKKGFFKYIYITSPVSRSPVSRLLSHGLLSHFLLSHCLLSHGLLSYVSCLMVSCLLSHVSCLTVSCPTSPVSCILSLVSRFPVSRLWSPVSSLMYPAVFFSFLKFKIYVIKLKAFLILQ